MARHSYALSHRRLRCLSAHFLNEAGDDDWRWCFGGSSEAAVGRVRGRAPPRALANLALPLQQLKMARNCIVITNRGHVGRLIPLSSTTRQQHESFNTPTSLTADYIPDRRPESTFNHKRIVESSRASIVMKDGRDGDTRSSLARWRQFRRSPSRQPRGRQCR